MVVVPGMLGESDGGVRREVGDTQTSAIVLLLVEILERCQYLELLRTRGARARTWSDQRRPKMTVCLCRSHCWKGSRRTSEPFSPSKMVRHVAVTSRWCRQDVRVGVSLVFLAEAGDCHCTSIPPTKVRKQAVRTSGSSLCRDSLGGGRRTVDRGRRVLRHVDNGR